jgi:hypothetical protein
MSPSRSTIGRGAPNVIPFAANWTERWVKRLLVGRFVRISHTSQRLTKRLQLHRSGDRAGGGGDRAGGGGSDLRVVAADHRDDRVESFRSRLRSASFSNEPPIERLLPPRFLRGEKVAKPDEGGFAGCAMFVVAGPCIRISARVWITSSAPSSAFGTFSPTKSVGEKALEFWGRYRSS